jgi:DNA-binding NtrC family response regulator
MTSYSILLIDDDEDILTLLKIGLESIGHDVIAATGGQEGIEIAETSAFDIVVTDILMEHGEGVETLSHLRKRYPEVPVIGISGNPLYLKMFDKLGASATLAKPFVPSELDQLIVAQMKGKFTGVSATGGA